MPVKKDPVEHLPPDILEKIFLYLRGGDLQNACCVSSAWRSYVVNYLWGVKHIKKGFRAKLEKNWRTHHYCYTDSEYDLPYNSYIDGMSAKYVAIRTLTSVPMENAKISVLDVDGGEFWHVPDVFQDQFFHVGFNDFRVVVSDELLGVRCKLEGEDAQQVQVWSIKEKRRLVAEQIRGLQHFHVSPTEEATNILILFAEQLQVWDFSDLDNVIKIRVNSMNEFLINGSFINPYLLQRFYIPEKEKKKGTDDVDENYANEDGSDDEDSSSDEETSESVENGKEKDSIPKSPTASSIPKSPTTAGDSIIGPEGNLIPKNEVVVWKHNRETNELEEHLVVRKLRKFCKLPNGSKLKFQVPDIIYIGDCFIITCKVLLPPVVGPAKVECLSIMIVGDDGLLLKQVIMPKYDPNAQIGFFIFETRFITLVDHDVLIYKFDIDHLKDPETSGSLLFETLNELCGVHEVMMSNLRGSTVQIVHAGLGQLKLKMKTVDYWKVSNVI